MPRLKPDKEYQKAYHQQWYANPENARRKKENAKIHRAKSKKRNREYVLQYKLTHPCVQCVHYHPEYIESYPVCLHFHHVNGIKDREIANLVTSMVSIERLQKEIDKCIVVCGNCHARLHQEMGHEGLEPPSVSM